MNYTLITGASGGIGLSFAETFVKHGHNLILVARNKEKLESIQAELETKYAVNSVV